MACAGTVIKAMRSKPWPGPSCNKTRSDLLGHRNSDMTTHYSTAELKKLIDAVNKIADSDSRKSHTRTPLRGNLQT